MFYSTIEMILIEKTMLEGKNCARRSFLQCIGQLLDKSCWGALPFVVSKKLK
jgi:hypothetical protein